MKETTCLMATARIATLVGALITAVIIAAGCSSGGKGGGNDQIVPVGTAIKGTVPGTIIHAIGDDGSYYRTETKPADPAPRPFILSVKPGIGYRLVLEENGVRYPVVFDAGPGLEINRFYMSVVGTALDLGFVSPSTSTGNATPEHNPLDVVDSDGDGTPDRADNDFTLPTSDPLDLDGDGILNVFDTDFVAGNNDRDHDGISDGADMDIDNDGVQNAADTNADGVGGTDSIPEILQRGYDQTRSLNALGAYQSFQEVVNQQPHHQLGNLGLAIARIGAVLTDFSPGTNPSKLESMKEILDRAGYSQEGRDLANFTSSPPTRRETISVDYGFGYIYTYTVSCTVFPDNSPTPNELRVYVNERLVPQLHAALDNLDAITPGFTFMLPSPFVLNGVSILGEVDYGDVLALKSLLRGILTALTFSNAYNIEFDLDHLVNNTNCNRVDPNTYHSISAQAFLDRYPNLVTLTDATALSGLKALATATVDDAIAALDAVYNETDGQDNDLVTIDRNTYASDRALLQQLNASFNGPQTFSLRWGTTLRLNSAPIFAGINLRHYLPTFIDDRVVYASIRAASYDPTIGGVLPDATREDVVRFFDKTPPTIAFLGLSATMSNPISFQVQADDVETLPDNSTQRGAGVDPEYLSLWWSCWPANYPYPLAYTGCTLMGQTGVGPITTDSNYGDLGQFFGPASSLNGGYAWTLSNAPLTVNTGGASPVNNAVWGQVRDAAGNYRWSAPDIFSVP